MHQGASAVERFLHEYLHERVQHKNSSSSCRRDTEYIPGVLDSGNIASENVF